MIFRLLFLALFACVSNVSYASDIQIQILNAQIEQLTTERDTKRSALDECLEKKKKMTVAGSVTLATTAIGAGVNIALASKLASADSGGPSAGGAGMPRDTRSQEQKNDDSCAALCSAGVSLDGCNC